MKRKIIKLIIILLGIVIFLLFILNPITQINSRNKEIIIQNNANNELIRIINNQKVTTIDINQISTKNLNILLAIEDEEFYKHNGFNIMRIFKTIITNLKYNQKFGASTITQQYIKNTYLTNEKKLTRKIQELYYAIKLEQQLTKQEILTKYLNCLYFGNNIYGLANASIYYFNKNYSNLTPNEMIILTAIINAPSYYTSNLDKLSNRTKDLAKYLFNKGVITNEEYLSAKKQVVLGNNKNIYSSNLLHYVDAVINEFNKLNLFSKFNEEIIIKTMYNSNTNDIKINTKTNYAAIAVNKEGYITTIIGNKNYYENTFNIVTKGTRDIGSTIKPLLYYEAIKCGFKDETYYSCPYTFKYNDELITIKNNASIYPYKKITMKEAIATSDNIYAIKTHQALGYKTLANHLKKYNVNTAALPSLCLGSVGISLYDLTRIYSQFFTEGKYLDFKYITAVIINNKIRYQSSETYQLLGNSTIFKQVKELLASPFDQTIPHSTASSITNKLMTKCYGKSGLTDYDAYMIGFNGDVLIGAWSGYLDNQKLIDSQEKQIPKILFTELINKNISN